MAAEVPLKTIAGRYQITAKLGEGGMGVVFRAYDPPPMDREVAVKTLHQFADPLALELFYKECSALKSISHPNIVEIFDMGDFDDEGHRKPFFVMPLLPGQTLDELIRKASHRLTVDRVVEIISQTCRGLQAAHERGLVHRDLKPSNIFVMADDSVKIIDFGVVRTANVHTGSAGFDKGTLIYMAPEQVQHKPVSVQSDIYSLGVTAYEALTRRQPFRGPTEDAVIQAILTQIPPPASDLNPSVSHVISRVVHKAIAKQPWNRFDTARELGDTLQKAARNEPIALFDPARTRPRIQTAAKALEKGDHQFAGEIIGELEAEGNIDPEITLLRTQIDQIARQKTIVQLLESARARYEEDEDPLALQKLQQILQLDPGNVAALGLKSKIEDRRSERQIEKWIQLARQHVNNHSYGHAREALQNALLLRPKDSRALRVLKEIESEEQEYVRLRREKTEIYQAAVNAWKNGEVSQALSQMKVVLDLDRRAPDASSPGASGAYQSFYDRIRSEHDAINNGYAEARRHLADRAFGKALEICGDFLSKYPGHALFQALKFDVEEHQRQQLSAFIADVDRRLESEPDLAAKVNLLREAVAEYPDEAHFARLLKLFEDKRDLVGSIVERARIHEERGQIADALSDLDTLQTIYAIYPGLRFEKDRLQKRLEQQARDTAKARWVRQVDQQLDAGEYRRAVELLDRADVEFPADAELVELRKLAAQGMERAARAQQLSDEGRALCAQGQFESGVALLENALKLDDRPTVRLALRDIFVARAQNGLDDDWRTVETFAERALEFDPSHSLARSLRAQAHDRRRDEQVGQCASQARRLQAAGEIDGALAEVDRGLQLYPADPRLSAIREALVKELDRLRPRVEERIDERSGRTPAPSHEAQQAKPDVERTRLVAGRRAPDPAPQVIITAAEAAALATVVPAGAPPAVAAPTTQERVHAAPASGALTSPSSRRLLWGAGAAGIAVVALTVAFLPPRATNEQAATVPGTPNPAPPASILTSETATDAADAPAPPLDATAAEAPTSVATLAGIQIRQLPPGMRVLLDGTPIGTVSASGAFSFSEVGPGRHSLRFEGPGYQPVTITREFAPGQQVALSSAEIALTRLPITVEFLADATTAITVVRAGETLHRFRGSAKVPLSAGAYSLTVQGPAGIPTTQNVTITGAAPVTINANDLVVGGMERFVPPNWKLNGEWYVRRGGGFGLYDHPLADGRYTYTVRLDRSGNPFSSGSRLRWVVAFQNDRNYVMLQLDEDDFYRNEVIDGNEQALVKREHDIPTNVPFVHLSTQVAGTQLVHQYSTDGTTWRSLDVWSRLAARGAPTAAPLAGKFGFFLPGNEELQISNFRYYPPAPTSR
jgi:serine/threonine-protein kinase